MFNLPIPDTELTASMDTHLRKQSLEDLAAVCLRHAARRQPLLLVLEDCHWIDPLSADLLETVGRDLALEPALILAVYRPPDVERPASGFTRLPSFSEIRLSELSVDETEHLIRQKLAQFGFPIEQVPVELVERVNERAQGNPFFVDEMVNWLHDRGISPDDSAALQSLDLPESLYGLIISRIDHLGEAAKTTLKIASVLGRSFRAHWLWGIFPDIGAPERVRQQLDQLAELEFTPLDRPEPELEYLFKHIVTREVAYDTLSLATRQMLHAQAGMFIESAYAEDLERFVDLLAYHYGLSTHTAKQREYFRKAAQVAQAAYANAVAVNYYRRLLPLSEGVEKAALLLQLGDLLLLTGEWNQAEQAVQQGLELAASVADWALQARAWYLLGVIERHRGNYPSAVDWLAQARRSYEKLSEVGLQGDVLREMGILHWIQGEYPQAVRLFQRCARLARAQNDPRRTSRALGNIGAVYLAQDNAPAALRYARRGLKLAEQVGDRTGMSIFAGNMGVAYQKLGAHRKALASFARYLSLSQELGYRMGISIAVGNLGDVYLDCGETLNAFACYRLNLKMALELGDQQGVAFGLWNVALASLAHNDLSAAEEFLQQAITIARTLNIPYELSDFLATQVELYLQMEKWQAAQESNQAALEAAQVAERQPLEFQAQVRQAWLAVQLGQSDPESAAQALIGLSDAAADAVQQADLAYTLYQVTRQDSPRQQAMEAYRALYARTPNALYRQRYRQLTGVELPPSAALPVLPELVSRQGIDLDRLLEQANVK